MKTIIFILLSMMLAATASFASAPGDVPRGDLLFAGGGCDLKAEDMRGGKAGAGYASGLLAGGYGSRGDQDVGGGSMLAGKKEIALSMLLPGLGHYRLGRTTRAKIYFGLEGAAWITAGAFYWQSLARRDAYEEYAVAFAGVRGTGYPEEYYETIGNYMSNYGPYGYNEYVLREARDLYYPDQSAIEAYYEANSITGDMSWRWETETAFRHYNDLFAGSDASRRRAVYALFFMLGLRIVSAVDTWRIARSDLRVPDDSGGTKLEFDPGPGGFRMSLCRSF